MLTIIAILCTNKLQITANYFLVNLAISDIIVCLIAEPFYMLALYHRKWPLSKEFCAAVGAISSISMGASVLNLLAISVNRYICIVKNMYYAKLYSNRRTVLYCVAVWIASLISVSPTIAGVGEFGFNKYFLVCGYAMTEETWKCQVGEMVVKFIVAISTIFFCYFKILKEVCKSSCRSNKHKGSDTSQRKLSGNEVNTKMFPKLPKQVHMLKQAWVEHRDRDFQVAKTSAIVILVFVLCWTPSVLHTIIDRDFSAPTGLLQVFAFLAMGNSSINPFIYAWRNHHFRKAYRRIITCQCQQEDLGIRDNSQF
ncbi:melatonin receptor type 1B-like [Anneissia japonica]|uniref:melatonin receptor type 1B-like n=1 Tax=Anneissia japonica TaxID=1529436 RepID=UPI001425682E|nr:melatonin receptor type 1B-like [Anneissia japonica]